jgi:hypothetical protein
LVHPPKNLKRNPPFALLYARIEKYHNLSYNKIKVLYGVTEDAKC